MGLSSLTRHGSTSGKADIENLQESSVCYGNDAKNAFGNSDQADEASRCASKEEYDAQGSWQASQVMDDARRRGLVVHMNTKYCGGHHH
jgi:hypothetical protein